MPKSFKVETLNEVLKKAEVRNSFELMSKGETFKDLSTICIIPIPGVKEHKTFLNCKKCKEKNEYVQSTFSGLHPRFVDAYYKHLMKPMNVPFVELIMPGFEVGDAYSTALNMVLNTPDLAKFKYVLTVEYDNIIPWMPDTAGPLNVLYEDIEKGYDVVGGLYWTKGTPSLPLVYGDPKEKLKDPAGYFKVRHDWKEGDLVECNGMGMGFTLFKMDIFKDTRLKKPFFKTVGEHRKKGPASYTQDLYFFQNIRKLGYKVAVDTKVKLGHMDLISGAVY